MRHSTLSGSMDRNVTLERRSSLNMTHLPNPIAESTTLNLNGSTTSGSNTSHFQWGGTSISSKQRSSSSSCLSNASTAQHSHRGVTASPQYAKMNLSKIDPRIYADVQSRGLASRIVKYHESGSRMNRSLSASNLYNRPGKFPVVHLQKKELPYRATQQNVSMTRIAPPEKSVFYGNTLSSLLRSNSVICLQKSDEEISRENRPILHPPAAESEMAPTRSVLDVLKEISRKRINSDETDIANDTIKKYCNRDYADGVYNGTSNSTNMRHISTSTSQLISPNNNTHLSYKRQREPISMQPQYSHSGHAVANASSVVANRSVHPAQIAQQPQPQPQHSPEQIAKKRLYSYNNDITSSLSSSIIHANKRKLYEQRHCALQRSSPPTAEEKEMHKAKIQRQQQPGLRFQQLPNTLSYATPITPIPSTPLSRGVETLRTAPSMPAATTLPSLPAVAEPKRTISEPLYMGARVHGVDAVIKPAASTKPKLTLFNKNYDEATTQTNCANGSVEDEHPAADDECADIQFVKPKKSNSLSSGKNPVIERTQKSKLALMLCGLRGELYQGDTDEVDSACSQPAAAVVSTTINASKNSLTLSTTVSTSTSNTTKTTTTTTTTTTTATAITNKSVPITITTNVTLGSGELKLPAMPVQSTSTPTPAAVPSQTTAASATVSCATTVAENTTKAAPVLGGFKFTPPAATTTSTTTNTIPITTTTINAASVAPAKSASPLVGIKLTPSTQTPTNLSAPLISFSGSTPPSSSLANSIATGVGPVPLLQGFAFHGSDKSASNTAPSTASASPPQSTKIATTQAGGFTFGRSTVTTNSAGGTTPSFGTFINTQPATASIVAKPSAKGPDAANDTVSPPLIFKAPTVATNANLTKSAFSFGGTALTATTTAPTSGIAGGTGTFTFGPTPTTTAPAFTVNKSIVTTANSAPFGTTSAATNAFSNTFAAATTTPTFAFGAPEITNSKTTSTSNHTTATTTSTGLFGFGTNNAQPKPAAAAAPFAFGGGVKPIPTTTTTAVATAPPTSGTFTFGQSNAPATPITTTAAPNMFAFGGASAQPPAASTTPNTTSNLFGNVGTTTASAAIKPTNFAFGSTAGADAQHQQAPPAFGSTATPFAFGGASTAEDGNVDKPAPASFGFGSTLANSTTPNPFGNNNTTAATHQVSNPATGVVKPSFSFGNSGNTTTTEAAKPLFGGASTNNNNNSSSNNTFGALAQQNKTFSFSANSNSNPTNIFGGAAGATAATTNNLPTNNAGGFSFGNSGNNSNSTPNATSGSKPIAAAFSFSGGSNSNNMAPFSFGNGSGGGGGLTTAPKLNSNSAAANPNFNFGTTTATNGGNIFGSTHKIDSAPAATPFSFSGGTATSTGASAPNGNLFAPPPSIGAGPENRPIRRATRRLQKS